MAKKSTKVQQGCHTSNPDTAPGNQHMQTSGLNLLAGHAHSCMAQVCLIRNQTVPEVKAPNGKGTMPCLVSSPRRQICQISQFVSSMQQTLEPRPLWMTLRCARAEREDHSRSGTHLLRRLDVLPEAQYKPSDHCQASHEKWPFALQPTAYFFKHACPIAAAESVDHAMLLGGALRLRAARPPPAEKTTPYGVHHDTKSTHRCGARLLCNSATAAESATCTSYCPRSAMVLQSQLWFDEPTVVLDRLWCSADVLLKARAQAAGRYKAWAASTHVPKCAAPASSLTPAADDLVLAHMHDVDNCNGAPSQSQVHADLRVCAEIC
jgi:hypothetical protein